MSIFKTLESLKKSWSVKIKGKSGYHKVKDVKDDGKNVSKNRYLLEDGSEVDHSEVEDLKIEDLKKSTKDLKTPRDEASEATKEDLSSPEYVNARKSRVSNAGEDIAGSARHKALEWKGLQHAEESGSAEALVTSKNLLKFNPPNINPKTANDVEGALYSHFAMQKFPKQPKVDKALEKFKDDNEFIGHIGMDRANRGIFTFNKKNLKEGTEKPVTLGDFKRKYREVFVDVYNKVKSKAEELSSSGKKANEASNELKKTVMDAINHHRQDILGSYAVNAFIPYVNKTLKYGTYKIEHNSAHHALSDFFISVADKLPKVDQRPSTLEEILGEKPAPPSNYDERDKALMEHARKIIGGKSLTDVGLKEKEKKKTFDPSQFYENGSPTRVGDDYGVSGHENHTKSLLNDMRIRGIQHGNSVTDAERAFHLEQTHNALLDMVNALGLPPAMASFNGRLGLAFGARGRSTAMAHYEPSLMTINMTRKKGVGSLAHEWSHAFDHILPIAKGRSGGKFATEVTSGWGKPAYEDPKAEEIHRSVQKLIDPLMSKIKQRVYKDWAEKDRGASIGHAHLHKYWLNNKEMFARAFEKYIDHKLIKQGKTNTYLSSASDHWLWPNKEETKELEPLFDDIFNNFKNSEYLKKSLELMNKSSYEEETKRIKESQKTPKAQKPHKFKAAEWTHPNGHPRCAICGDEESVSGVCRGESLEKGLKDSLPGGKGDKASPKDFDPEQVKMGMKVEMEHTNDPHVALEVALDHLSENPSYYSKLKESGLADELEKDIGRISFPKTNHKWTRPDQEGYLSDDTSPFVTRKMQIAGAKHSEDTGDKYAGVFDPNSNKYFVNKEATNTVKEHEAHHVLVNRMVEKHGLEKINNLYTKLIDNHIHPAIKQLINNALKANEGYMRLLSSRNPRNQLHYKEEVVNTLRDFIHGNKVGGKQDPHAGNRRAILMNYINNNPSDLKRAGFESAQHFDAELKRNWNKLRDAANNVKPEDL